VLAHSIGRLVCLPEVEDVGQRVVGLGQLVHDILQARLDDERHHSAVVWLVQVAFQFLIKRVGHAERAAQGGDDLEQLLAAFVCERDGNVVVLEESERLVERHRETARA